MKFLTSIFILCALAITAGAQSITSSIGTSTGGNGSTDANKAPKFDANGYLHAKRFISGTGTGGTLSGEAAFTDFRTINILTTTATFTAATDVVTTAAAHGRQVGDAVIFTTGGSLSGTGITSGTTYFVRTVPSTTTLTLTASPGSTVLDLTGAGTGTHTITSASPHSFADERTFLVPTGLATDALNSFDGIAQIGSGSGTEIFNHYGGLQVRAKFNGSAMTNYYGISLLPEFTRGTTTNLRNIFIGAPALSGGAAVTTVYGIQIGDLAKAGVTYPVAIASDYSGVYSWHVGRFSFGYGSVPPTDSQVYVYPNAANLSAIKVANYSLTGSSAVNMLNLAGTWNTSGTPTAALVNITDTASNAASKLLDLQIGGTSKFSVGKNGIYAIGSAAPTIASATTIAPTTPILFVSGTTTVSTITAPSPISAGGGQITIIPTGTFATNTAGNIALASTAVVSKALIMTYDVTTAKWYPSY